ncbi:MAG: ATP-binding protein [Gemmatimonadota bacterium]
MSEGSGAAKGSGAHAPPRRFVVPTLPKGKQGATGETVATMRRLAREGGILLEAERTAFFLFGDDGEPVRRVVRFHLHHRGFDPPEGHPAALADEVRRLMTSVSRVAVSDLTEHPPPPGAMRQYLEEEGVRSLLSLPIRDEEGAIRGFISFEAVSGPRVWSDEDRQRALEVAQRLEELLRAGGNPPARPDESVDEAAVGRTLRGSSGLPGSPPSPWSAPPPAVAPGTEAATERREVTARLPRLRPLEGAGLIAADMGSELLHLLEVQEGTHYLLEEALAGSEDADVLDDLKELTKGLRDGLGAILRASRGGIARGEVVDLNSSVASILHQMAGLAGERARFLISPSVDPLPVRADVPLLARALEHLIRNAQEATTSGGRVRVSLERARLEVGSSEEGSRTRRMEVARIRVEDDGAGILPEHLPWIFEPYFTSDPDPGGRRGLGLPAVQAIAELHGGWVDVHSRTDKGTLVTLQLPLADRAPHESAGAEDEAAPSPESTSRTVLLVEEDRALARFLSRVLSRAGFEVLVAGSPSEAGRHWEDVGDQVGLVVVRRRGSGTIDGLGLVGRWRRERADLPALLIERTGEISPLGRQSTREPATGGPPGHGLSVLTAPFEPRKVVDAVRDALAATRSGSLRSDEAMAAAGGVAH